MVRGRPKSPQEGAAKIVDSILALKVEFSLSDNKLSELSGLPQSGISRSLGKKPPTMTPTLQKLNLWINSNALFWKDGRVRSAPRTHSLEEGEAKIAAKARDMWDGSETGLANVLSIMDAIRGLIRPPSTG